MRHEGACAATVAAAALACAACSLAMATSLGNGTLCGRTLAASARSAIAALLASRRSALALLVDGGCVCTAEGALLRRRFWFGLCWYGAGVFVRSGRTGVFFETICAQARASAASALSGSAYGCGSAALRASSRCSSTLCTKALHGRGPGAAVSTAVPPGCGRCGFSFGSTSCGSGSGGCCGGCTGAFDGGGAGGTAAAAAAAAVAIAPCRPSLQIRTAAQPAAATPPALIAFRRACTSALSLVAVVRGGTAATARRRCRAWPTSARRCRAFVASLRAAASRRRCCTPSLSPVAVSVRPSAAVSRAARATFSSAMRCRRSASARCRSRAGWRGLRGESAQNLAPGSGGPATAGGGGGAGGGADGGGTASGAELM